MSYLNPIRLHFAGQFQADPSTVNNDVRHFDTPEFKAGWQQVNQRGMPNGWWNPDGSGSFRLVGCKVTSVGYSDGTTSTDDPIVGMQIAGANARVAGKLVDLDPQQQMVSQIWGLQVRLTDGTSDLFSGNFSVAPFADLWFRAQGSGSDMGMSAFYQSVLGPVTWAAAPSSRLLQELSGVATDGLLSIKFNVDGYNNNTGSAGFTLGRCVGTIGPATAAEPEHFVVGRQLLPSFEFDPRNGPTAVGPMYFMPAVVNSAASKIYADFGNALPTNTPGSDLADIGSVEIGWLDANDGFTSLGTVNGYTAAGWYEQNAGVVAFPISATDVTTANQNRLAIRVDGTVTLMENLSGMHVRADNFVSRLNPGQPANVTVWASQYGQPLAGASVSVAADPSQLQPGAPTNDPLTNNITPPDVATPPDKISFDSTITTGPGGSVTLVINSSDPGAVRDYVDGQVYGVRCLPAATAAALGNPPNFLNGNPTTAFGFNPGDVISLLVWSGYVQPETPQWSDVAPILAQYAVLYPVMDQLIDLTSETEVNQQAPLLRLAFGLPVTDPNSMPVTRDLSDAKRATLLQYLGAQMSASPTAVGAAPHGKPVVMAQRKVAAGATTAEVAGTAEPPKPRDSKTIAMRNRGTTPRK